MTGAGCWLTWRARSLMAAKRSATSGVIGDQGELFGPVASVRAVWRALAEIAAGGTVTAGRVTAAVNAAGRSAWAGIAVRHGAPPGVRVADQLLESVTFIRLDASVVTCHSRTRSSPSLISKGSATTH